MWDYVIKVLLIMLVLFLFIVPGFVLQKCKLLPASALPALANILLYVCQPALIVKAFCVDPVVPSASVFLGMAWCMALSLVGMLVIYFLAKLCFFRCKNRKKSDIYLFLATFSNCGFIGVPFVDMLTDGDSEAMMYMSCFNVAFNVLVWTLGVYLMTQNRKDMNLRKAFLNPSVVASVFALVLFSVPSVNIFNLEAVAEIGLFVEDLSAMTAPLSMIIVGVRLAETPFVSLFTDWVLYPAAFLRLIVSPLLTYLFGWLLQLTGALEGMSLYVWLAPAIAMAMSPASSVVAYAERFGGDSKTATRGFILLTLMSILTIPFLIAWMV